MPRSLPSPGSPRRTAVRAAAALALALAVAALGPLAPTALAQGAFVAVTDSTNPIVAQVPAGSYTGASWIDADGDGLLDLFMSQKGAIFRNLGGGQFEKVSTVISGQGQSLGNTWADYDNDGDLDVFVVGQNSGFLHIGSFLYRNDGGLTFTKVLDGAMADSIANTGWGCAWADIDADGYTDLVVAAANGFGFVTHENRLLYNLGNGSFVAIDSTVVTDSLDAHTIPTWSDYDLDGDPDLFIGSGEVTQLSPDNLFRNVRAETGSWGFERITTDPIATDPVNGQVWNWIDYDNDGDLDGFLTNYGGALANFLYRNDGGTYVRMTEGDVGTIVSDANSALASNWGDFDNDGDLDCLVTNDGPAACDLFWNDGDGTFTQDFASAVVAGGGPHYSASLGDTDRDGDLDLYVHGTATTKTLYRNDLANGNAWLVLRLAGSGAPGGSNVAAIGALVRAKATIGGVPTWQIREVSSQNSFNAMNALDVHFGLGDATVVDSLVVRWPSGGTTVRTVVPVDRLLDLVEGSDPTGAPSVAPAGSPDGPRLAPPSPNPFGSATRLDFELPVPARIELRVFDVSGRLVRTVADGRLAAGVHARSWDARDDAGRPASSGVYFLRLRATSEGASPREVSRRVVLRR